MVYLTKRTRNFTQKCSVEWASVDACTINLFTRVMNNLERAFSPNHICPSLIFEINTAYVKLLPVLYPKGATTFSTTTFSITIFSIATLGIKGLFATLSTNHT